MEIDLHTRLARIRAVKALVETLIDTRPIHEIQHELNRLVDNAFLFNWGISVKQSCIELTVHLFDDVLAETFTVTSFPRKSKS